MTMPTRSEYYIPAGSAIAPFTVHVTPESAGWAECSLFVVELMPGGDLTLDTAGTKVMILPLRSGGSDP